MASEAIALYSGTGYARYSNSPRFKMLSNVRTNNAMQVVITELASCNVILGPGGGPGIPDGWICVSSDVTTPLYPEMRPCRSCRLAAVVGWTWRPRGRW